MDGNREALGTRFLVLEEQYKMAAYFTRISLFPELAEKQANEDRGLKSIEVSMFWLVFKPGIIVNEL